MRTALEIPELRKLHAWACETLDVRPDIPLDERTSLFLNQVIENEGFVSESKWQAYQLLVSLERNSVIPARHDSEFANIVHEQINEYIKDLFSLTQTERQQRFKVLQMVASKDALLSLRVERLKPFLSINTHSQNLPQPTQSAFLTLCRCAIASAENRKETWLEIYAAAIQDPEAWKHAALLLQKQLSAPQSSIHDQLGILIESDYSLKQLSKRELKFYFRNFRLKHSPGQWFGKASDSLAQSSLGIIGAFVIFIALIFIGSARTIRRPSYSSPLNTGVSTSLPNASMSYDIIKKMQEEHQAANPNYKPDLSNPQEQLKKILDTIRDQNARSRTAPFERDGYVPQDPLMPNFPNTPFSPSTMPNYPPPTIPNYSPPTIPNYSPPTSIDQLSERYKDLRRTPSPAERMPLPSVPNPFVPNMNSAPNVPGVRP